MRPNPSLEATATGLAQVRHGLAYLLMICMTFSDWGSFDHILILIPYRLTVKGFRTFFENIFQLFRLPKRADASAAMAALSSCESRVDWDSGRRMDKAATGSGSSAIARDIR